MSANDRRPHLKVFMLTSTFQQRYADTLASTTHSYGPALIYLARARSPAKLNSTLGLLASLCLIHSSAYPAPADLDPQLASLLSGPRTALVALARTDADAANLLASHLSGYATLRRFYQLRDQGQGSVDAQESLRPLARAREAAKALLAVLASASDCIRGGLYDPDTESVLPVDGVLALLGELLPLLGQRKRVFSQEQVFFLLRVVEDFASAPSRVREDAEELFGACLGAYREEGGSASVTLRKSRSDLARSSASGGLGGSSWDMLASSTMAVSRSGERAAAVVAGWGWDWRKGLESIGTTMEGEGAGRDVIVMVRTALAQEVAKGWTGGNGW